MSATTRTFQQAQERAARQTARAVEALWASFDPAALDDSWARQADRLFVAVASGQSTAAGQADPYLNALAAEQATERRPDAKVNPRAVAGVASDGRPLETLLYQPVLTAKAATAQGATLTQAMQSGAAALQMLSATQTLDAGRHGVAAGMAASPTVTGYRRQVNDGACSRCVVLAGKWYRSADPFLRHPFCACTHVPAIGPRRDVEGLAGFDPQAHFDSLTAAEQERVFTKAGAEAIREGADIGQVVNARRGMTTTTAYGRRIQTTTVGTGRRNTSFTRAMRAETGPQTGIRLMPEQIFRDATSREDAVRLLKRNGYLT